MSEEMVIPDVAEPMLGFRVWRVVEGARESTLWSVTRGEAKKPPRTRVLLSNPDGAWPVGKLMEASCDRFSRMGGPKDHGEEVPAVDCTCGFYATYDIDVAAAYIRGAPVLGLVQGSGRVIPGEATETSAGGFRAQRISIACLFDIASDFTIHRRGLRKLADCYQVPLVRPHSDVAEDYRELVRSGWRDR
jgi:hypothetical protein